MWKLREHDSYKKVNQSFIPKPVYFTLKMLLTNQLNRFPSQQAPADRLSKRPIPWIQINHPSNLVRLFVQHGPLTMAIVVRVHHTDRHKADHRRCRVPVPEAKKLITALSSPVSFRSILLHPNDGPDPNYTSATLSVSNFTNYIQ